MTMTYLIQDRVIDKVVCGNCISEPFISKHIKSSGTKEQCSYCNKKVKVLPFTNVIEIVSEGFHYGFEDVADEWPYDEDGEHGYHGTTFDLYDIFDAYDELGLRIEDDTLREDVKSMFDDERIYGHTDEYGSYGDDCTSGWLVGMVAEPEETYKPS